MLHAKCPLCQTDVPDSGKTTESCSGEITEVKKCPSCSLFFRIIVEADVWEVAVYWVNKTKEV